MGFPGATKMGTTGGAFDLDEETSEKIGRVKASRKGNLCGVRD
jgi:hypothetical protein